MSDQRDFKGVWIPREIWLDTNLSALEKVLFAEIDSLSGYSLKCIKSNASFAEFCQCSESKVSKAIKKLIDLGYVEQVAFDGRHRTLQSRLAKSAMQDDTKCYADEHKVTASNTDSNTDSKSIENTPLNPPKGEGANETVDINDLLKEFMPNQQEKKKLTFEDWYSHYPRKEARQRAEKAWKKIKPDQVTIQQMIDAVEIMKTKDKWTKENGQYIPLPATWLNDGRWMDEEAQPEKEVVHIAHIYDEGGISANAFRDTITVEHREVKP